MTKRRSNGEGSIRKRNDGRWEGRYTAGHDPETGKAIYKNVLGKTQSEVREKLRQAIAQKLILTNPTNGCALPQVERQEMKTLSADQLSAFPREAKETGVYETYYFELVIGLRRGELLGLKWEDVDWHRRTIRICRQVARINDEIVEAPFKTKNAYRTLSLGDGAMAVLETQEKKSDDEYIFPSLNGGPMSPDSVQNMLNRVLKRAGLPKIRVHDLRHSYVKYATTHFCAIFN